jgi:Protein of unknwon function (DUF3310)
MAHWGPLIDNNALDKAYPSTTCPNCGIVYPSYMIHKCPLQKLSPMDFVNNYHETKDKPDPFKNQVGGGHYKSMKIQPIEFVLANELGFCEGNIIKYTCRYKQKGGKEDLKKVIHYAELLIAQLEKDTDT